MHTTTTTTTTITATATTATTAHNKLKCICYIPKLNYWWFWKYIIPFGSRRTQWGYRQTRVGRKQQMFHCHKFPNQKEIFLPVAYIALKWDNIEIYLQSFKFQQRFLPNFFFFLGYTQPMKPLSRAKAIPRNCISFEWIL